ncbi:MAG: ImmA/IrrE family metallo-endopeptidase [Chloroflexi bacterium]|nr:MAG: ImmA/IrrE family metallo-endopeptidase [Chloroflexota bacterium]
MTSRNPESAARELLSQLHIVTPPVPVETIPQRLGARITYTEFEGTVSGMLFRDESRGQVIIGVNHHHAKTRQRFTLAHEIAHLLLHRGKPVIVDRLVKVNLRNRESSMATNTQEIEANRFAAEFLMPRMMVNEQVEKLLTSDPDLAENVLVVHLARTFGVSSEAMSYRLINLGIRVIH